MISEVSKVLIDQIKPSKNNSRKHPKKQIRQLKKSLKRFKVMRPILVNPNGEIICGHGIYQAALELGHKSLHVIYIEHLSDEEIRAYQIADNKLAENSEWDYEILISEISDLIKIDSSFDVDLIGFSTGEIDVIISDQSPNNFEEPMPDPPKPSEVASKLDDIWICGSHRIGVGDTLDPHFVDCVMAGQFARMVAIDPPYNVPIPGHVSGNGKICHDDFLNACGEMSSEQFTEFLIAASDTSFRVSTDGSLHYIFIDWRHLSELLSAGNQVFDQYINLCVWAKTNGGMGSLYRSQHELCLIFKKGTVPHINNVELGKHGRNRSNVWNYPGMNSFGTDRDELLAAHPTVKPVRMIADAIMDVTHHGDIVFDGFLGSGTTLIAAEQTKRICYGIEIDPRYVDVSLKRWTAETGEMPILESSGQSFEEVAADRLNAVVEEVANDQ